MHTKTSAVFRREAEDAVKTRHTSLFLFAVLALTAWLLPLKASLAQAPPGPQPRVTPEGGPPPPPVRQTPRVKPRQTILGGWVLNPDESDNPRDKAQQSHGGRGGYGGGRPGGYPGGRGGYGGRGGENDDARERMRELMMPANAIQLAMTGAEVDLTDNLDRKRAFMTDGRKLQKSKDSAYEEITAHWEGKRLVSDEKDARGNKMSRTLELSPDGMQLYETFHLTTGRSNTPLVIRYVYDATDNAGADRSPPSRRPS
jgi:hypothetical protein